MKNNRKILVFIIFTFILVCFNNVYAAPRCSCGEDRVLKLENPPMIGKDVLEMQTQLKNLGFYNHKLHGIYDKNTKNATKNFQKSVGLNIDGVFGLDTLKALAFYYEKPVINQSKEKPNGEVEIVINTLDRMLIVMRDGKPFKSFPVAVGKFKTPTPIGLFHIIQKSAWGEGFGSRWMKLSVPWGIYGIHGTNKPWSVGSFESAGCIRMHNQNVEEVYDWVDIGTRVYIIGGVDGPFTFGLRTLVPGSKGSDVVEVQKRLAGYGFYDQNFDGIYGPGTEKAVRDFQKSNDINPSGNTDSSTYKALGIQLFE